ncbi:MAG: BrnT family toxin [Devosia sp.]
MQYVWDEEKNRTNRAKHGIRFEVATKVFDDPYIVSRYQGYENGEHRYHVLGLADGVMILFVVFTDRRVGLGETVTRIISARRADPAERRIYEEERRSHGGF